MTLTETRKVLISTKQYRRFAEFADTCREERYIGLCYGSPGVGKSFSARHYSKWDYIDEYHTSIFEKMPPKGLLKDARTVYYIAPVGGTARIVERQLVKASRELYYTVQETLPKKFRNDLVDRSQQITELLIVDEADRLKFEALEQVRDFHDRTGAGVILVGMPGLEKRLSRYPQLYSRVGFVHEFESLSIEEVRFILEKKWDELGLPFNPDDFADHEALASIARITNGNFRLIQRLLSQSFRIMSINKLKLITSGVIETARDSLVIGQT